MYQLVVGSGKSNLKEHRNSVKTEGVVAYAIFDLKGVN